MVRRRINYPAISNDIVDTVTGIDAVNPRIAIGIALRLRPDLRGMSVQPRWNEMNHSWDITFRRK